MIIDNLDNYFQGKRIMVTGAAGTIGKELLKQLIQLKASEIIAIDLAESPIFYLYERYRGTIVNAFTCDICDSSHVERIMHDVDIVFHCAAFKHVSLGEISPYPLLKTNIIGLQNIIDAALKSRVKKVIFASSDKAANPTNVMGTTKLLGERLITAANNQDSMEYPIFSSVRFGNVIGSSGSVLCIFKQQISEGKNLTLTNKEMTRFFMTITEAASFVIQALVMSKGGEVLINKMPIFRIEDLCRAMILEFAQDKEISIDIVGNRLGEKLYEELVTEDEMSRSLNFGNFIAIKPAFPVRGGAVYEYNGRHGDPVNRPYRSSSAFAWSVDKIREFLIENRLFD